MFSVDGAFEACCARSIFTAGVECLQQVSLPSPWLLCRPCAVQLPPGSSGTAAFLRSIMQAADLQEESVQC